MNSVGILFLCMSSIAFVLLGILVTIGMTEHKNTSLSEIFAAAIAVIFLYIGVTTITYDSSKQSHCTTCEKMVLTEYCSKCGTQK